MDDLTLGAAYPCYLTPAQQANIEKIRRNPDRTTLLARLANLGYAPSKSGWNVAALRKLLETACCCPPPPPDMDRRPSPSGLLLHAVASGLVEIPQDGLVNMVAFVHSLPMTPSTLASHIGPFASMTTSRVEQECILANQLVTSLGGAPGDSSEHTRGLGRSGFTHIPAMDTPITTTTTTTTSSSSSRYVYVSFTPTHQRSTINVLLCAFRFITVRITPDITPCTACGGV